MNEQEQKLKPQIIVKTDYDGYFKQLVQNLVDSHIGPFNHETIIITAGPYRPYAVSYSINKEDKSITLDFYSALRTGFGHLSNEDLARLNEKL